MAEATQIMCGGTRNFVFAENPITGLVEATTTYDNPDSSARLSDAQLAVLQLANLSIKDVAGWSVDPVYVDVMRSSTLWAKVNSGSKDVNRTMEAFFTTGKVPHADIATNSVDGQVLNQLRSLSAFSIAEAAEVLPCRNVQDEDWGRHLLVEHGISGCQDALSRCADMNGTRVRGLCPITCGCPDPVYPAAAFFASPAFGCPQACEMSQRAVEQRQQQLGDKFTCLDTSTPSFSTEKYLIKYFHGLYQFITASISSVRGVGYILQARGHMIGIPTDRSKEVFYNVVNAAGEFWYDVTHGHWRFAKGLRHPRRLTGCAFWTSWEVAFLLGIDLCGVGHFRSLRAICPVSCGCRSGMDECPHSCVTFNAR